MTGFGRLVSSLCIISILLWTSPCRIVRILYNIQTRRHIKPQYISLLFRSAQLLLIHTSWKGYLLSNEWKKWFSIKCQRSPPLSPWNWVEKGILSCYQSYIRTSWRMPPLSGKRIFMDRILMPSSFTRSFISSDVIRETKPRSSLFFCVTLKRKWIRYISKRKEKQI